MSDRTTPSDVDIIHTAYAEKVGEAFKIFAENLAVGQSEHACMDQFKRTLQWSRKARDLTLQALGTGNLEPGATPSGVVNEEPVAEPLSAEDQALIDQVLRGTTGAAPPPPPQRGYRGR